MNRPRRVLCPIDLRQPSHAALDFAAMIAEEFESVLDAVYVPEGHAPRTTRLFAPRVHAVEKLMADHKLKEDLSSLVRARAPRIRSTSTVRWGGPLRSVLAEASRRQSDVIVVGGPHQPSTWRCTARFADALASDAPCPVLTVPERDPPERPSRILLAIDRSDAADAAVDWTILLARRFEASVDVLHAERVLVGTPAERLKIERRFGRSGVRATVRSTRGASVLADIVGQSAGDPCELVVIGVERGHAGRLDASFVERLRKLASTPVLSIVANAVPQPMPSLDPVARFGELLPSALATAG